MVVAREPVYILVSRRIHAGINGIDGKPSREKGTLVYKNRSTSRVSYSSASEVIHRWCSYLSDNPVNTVEDAIDHPETIRPRGRPRVSRKIEPEGPVRCYAPQCHVLGSEEVVVLLPEELELLKLVDLQGLEQEEAATSLGVSRRTVWRDLHEARRKVADALVHGKGIEVSGCTLRTEGRCPRLADSLCPKEEGGTCPKCWQRSNLSQD